MAEGKKLAPQEVKMLAVPCTNALLKIKNKKAIIVKKMQNPGEVYVPFGICAKKIESIKPRCTGRREENIKILAARADKLKEEE